MAESSEAAAGDFFRPEKAQCKPIDAAGFAALLGQKTVLRNLNYIPAVLAPPAGGTKKKPILNIRDRKFIHVDFSATKLENITFERVIFENCLFAQVEFSHCDFYDCNFIACNMNKCSFTACHISPRSFRHAFPGRKYALIAVSLYAALLKNCREQYQPYFSDDALYMLRSWGNIVRRHDRHLPFIWRCGYFMLDKLLRRPFGYGLKIGNLTVTMLVLILGFSLLNEHCATAFGLQNIGQTSSPFIDAVYFTISVMTTLGFGDIVPTTILGKIIVALQCLTGFSFLGIFASMLSRKLSL